MTPEKFNSIVNKWESQQSQQLNPTKDSSSADETRKAWMIQNMISTPELGGDFVFPIQGTTKLGTLYYDKTLRKLRCKIWPEPENELPVKSDEGTIINIQEKDKDKLKLLLNFYNEYTNGETYPIAQMQTEQLVNPLIDSCGFVCGTQQDISDAFNLLVGTTNPTPTTFDAQFNKLVGIVATTHYENKSKSFRNDRKALPEHMLYIGNEHVKQNITYQQAIDLDKTNGEPFPVRNGNTIEQCVATTTYEPIGKYVIISIKMWEEVYVYDNTKNKEVKDFKKIHPTECRIQKSENLQFETQNYELFAYIVHQSDHTESGHYVAYVKTHDKWVYFNDTEWKNVEDSDNTETKWNCLKCTFENESSAQECKMCGNKDKNPVPYLAFYKRDDAATSSVPNNRGIVNPNNNCYINALLQVIIRIPEYIEMIQEIVSPQ